jgi:hypothetical protein
MSVRSERAAMSKPFCSAVFASPVWLSIKAKATSKPMDVTVLNFMIFPLVVCFCH